jgi:hypothetical protein
MGFVGGEGVVLVWKNELDGQRKWHQPGLAEQRVFHIIESSFQHSCNRQYAIPEYRFLLLITCRIKGYIKVASITAKRKWFRICNVFPGLASYARDIRVVLLNGEEHCESTLSPTF